MRSESHDGVPERGLGEGVYDRLLDETRQVANKALERLRGLSEQLPEGMVEQVERLHDDPIHERRKTARVSDSSIPVAARFVAPPNPTNEVAIKDHCPTGMAVRLPCPAGVGTILRLRMPPQFGESGWVTVEVKYCRREGEGWIAGCELLDNQPLI